MGLDKFIVNQAIGMAEDSAKVQDALDVMEDKLEAEVIKLIEGSGINPQLLPFNPIKLIKGEETLDPMAILKPDVLCLLPPLTAAQQAKSQDLIDNLKLTLSAIIDNINSLKEALVTIQEPLITLEVTAETMDTTISTVSAVIKAIKAIPAPVAVFGVGIPTNVLTILSDILVQSDKMLTAGKGVVSLIPPLINNVVGIIAKTIAGVDGITSKVEPILTIASFIQAKITLGDNCPNITPEQINQVQSNISTDILADIAALGDSSIPQINTFNEDELLESLQNNSNPPFIYQGFTFIIEYDPTNSFDFPRRRIKANRNFASQTSSFYTIGNFNAPLNGVIILYNDPKNNGGYSFSSSVQILIKEMQYKIDQYLAGVSEIVNLPEMVPDDERAITEDKPIFNLQSDESRNPETPQYLVNFTQGNGTVNPTSGSSISTIGTITPSPGIDEGIELAISLNPTLGGGGAGNINITQLGVKLSSAPNTDYEFREYHLTATYPYSPPPPIIISSPGIYDFFVTINGGNVDTSLQIQTELLITVL
tara:strand:+ start:7 stop:1617 length:1611 start_codon:yes stop_codon:yes gene_type:complete